MYSLKSKIFITNNQTHPKIFGINNGWSDPYYFSTIDELESFSSSCNLRQTNLINYFTSIPSRKGTQQK